MFRQFKPSEELTKYLFCSTRASTLTEITDSVKKSQKQAFLTLFYMFLSVFEAFSKVKICKLTIPISLLIFGVFLKNQGLNLQHTDFSLFFKGGLPYILAPS